MFFLSESGGDITNIYYFMRKDKGALLECGTLFNF